MAQPNEAWISTDKPGLRWQWTSATSIEIEYEREDGMVMHGTVGWPNVELAQNNAEAAVYRFTKPSLQEEAGVIPGQGRQTYRKGPFWLTRLWGPPTWWTPQVRVSIRKRRIMVGWLRRGYVLAVR